MLDRGHPRKNCMKLKKVAPAQVVLSFDECKRVADFVMLLATVDRRLKTKKAQEKKNRKAKGIYKPLDKGPPNKRAFWYAPGPPELPPFIPVLI